MARRAANGHKKNGKIDHHGLPIPSRVKDVHEFMRLVNLNFPNISGDIKTLPEIRAFLNYFNRQGSRLDLCDQGTDVYGQVVDFWEKALSDSGQADKATSRFIQVAVRQHSNALPENVEIMARIAKLHL